MEAFLQPLQSLAEIEEIKNAVDKNRGILEVSVDVWSPRKPSDVWAFRAFSMSSDPCA